jgi:hypothetical protein
MIRRGARTFCKGLAPHALLAILTALAPAGAIVQAATGSSAPAVTATPPLLAVPATPVSKNVQQRMRACNATADARKLQTAAREAFLKSCMSVHRARTTSRAGSEPKPHP